MDSKELEAITQNISFTDEEVSQALDSLLVVQAVLGVLSCLDDDQPDALENGYIMRLALEAKTHLDNAIEILIRR